MLFDIRDLSKEYKRANKSFLAVDHVNLSIEKKDFICITGRSGSGKSTFLNMLVGLISPTSGHINFLESDFSKMNDNEISFLRNTDVGFISQDQGLLSNLTVFDNVRLPYYIFNKKGNVTKKTMDLLEKVGMAQIAKMYPSELSGGEMRRVSIARALINSPKIIIADEPTSNLDAETAKKIMELFSDISSNGTAILLVTHDLDFVKYCNRTYRMNAGKLSEEIKN